MFASHFGANSSLSHCAKATFKDHFLFVFNLLLHTLHNCTVWTAPKVASVYTLRVPLPRVTTRHIESLVPACISLRMAGSDFTIHDLAPPLIWNCLVGTVNCLKNPIFSQVLPSKAVVQELFSTSGFDFAPGLLDVMQSTHPPNVTYFMGLPVEVKNRWGIYVVVMKKPGCRPLAYIGSGTSRDYGVHARFNNYKDGHCLPLLVSKAFNDGYKIVHKGLLCWTPIPTSTKLFPLRVLFLALESTFSFFFWTMQSKTADYFMSHAFFWSLDDVQYDGLCSHSPFMEAIDGSAAGLTAAQHEAVAVERKEKRLANTRRSVARAKEEDSLAFAEARKQRDAIYKEAHPELRCEPCGFHFHSHLDLERHIQTTSHQNTIGSLPRTYNQTVYARNVNEKRYNCDICDTPFGNIVAYKDHCKTPKHIERANAAGVSPAPVDQSAPRRNAADTTIYCSPCDKSMSNHSNYVTHCKTKKHRQRVNPKKQLFKLPALQKKNAAIRAAKSFHCPTCDMAFPSRAKLNTHFESQRHLDREEALMDAVQKSS